MTTAEAIAKFSYLQDERGSPNFEDDEVLILLNMASLERLKRLVPDDQGGAVNLEMDANTLMNVRPLIYNVSTSMNSSGVITFAAINAALQTASGDAACTAHRLLGVTFTASSVDYPAKYTAHNRWATYKRNVFKTSDTNVRYKVDATNLTFYPISTTATIGITCLKTPKVMAADNSPDWDDSNMNTVIEIALQLAGQASRDHELLATIQQSNISK